MDDVYSLHMCTTEEKYNADLDSFFEKFNGCAILECFQTQWLVAPFNRWQIFRNLPGYANTNSNIESFNATVTRDIIERIKISVSENEGSHILFYNKC